MDYYTLSYILIFVSILITIVAQIFVSASYFRYSEINFLVVKSYSI